MCERSTQVSRFGKIIYAPQAPRERGLGRLRAPFPVDWELGELTSPGRQQFNLLVDMAGDWFIVEQATHYNSVQQSLIIQIRSFVLLSYDVLFVIEWQQPLL